MNNAFQKQCSLQQVILFKQQLETKKKKRKQIIKRTLLWFLFIYRIAIIILLLLLCLFSKLTKIVLKKRRNTTHAWVRTLIAFVFVCFVLNSLNFYFMQTHILSNIFVSLNKSNNKVYFGRIKKISLLVIVCCFLFIYLFSVSIFEEMRRRRRRIKGNKFLGLLFDLKRSRSKINPIFFPY